MGRPRERARGAGGGARGACGGGRGARGVGGAIGNAAGWSRTLGWVAHRGQVVHRRPVVIAGRWSTAGRWCIAGWLVARRVPAASAAYSQRSVFGSSRMRITRAGTPATTAFAGTSRVTTALVPITALSPTVTPRRMQAP
jgi:hypothetical protein